MRKGFAVMGEIKKNDQPEDEHLTDEEIEAILLAGAEDANSDSELSGAPLFQRRWFKRVIGVTLTLMLLGNILAFWPTVYSMAAIQFLKTSAQLSQDEAVQLYKEAIVVVKADNRKGTGFAFTQDGMILTNAHVVGDSEQPVVHFADGSSHVAVVLADNSELDLALLRLKDSQESAEYSYLPLAEFTDVPGASFYVIGNPLFFFRIANEGVILGMHPSLEPSRVMLDAPIYNGNSGSPVINENGKVIAVVYATTKIEYNGQKQTVGLGIPVEHVRKFLQEEGKLY